MVLDNSGISIDKPDLGISQFNMNLAMLQKLGHENVDQTSLEWVKIMTNNG